MVEAAPPPALDRSSKMEGHCSKLRRLFSPPTMLHNDEAATIDFAYFKPKKVTDKWTDSERIRLLKGIEEYGLHDGECWSMIHDKYLRKRQFAEVRIECCRLIGRQDLSHYRSFAPGTLDETTIEDERKKNEVMGKAQGKWVCGLYQDIPSLTASQLEASRRVDFGVPQTYEALHQGHHQVSENATGGVILGERPSPYCTPAASPCDTPTPSRGPTPSQTPRSSPPMPAARVPTPSQTPRCSPPIPVRMSPPPPMASAPSWTSSSSKSKKKKLKKRPHPSGIDAGRQQHTASRRRVAPSPPPPAASSGNSSGNSSSGNIHIAPSPPPPSASSGNSSGGSINGGNSHIVPPPPPPPPSSR